MDTSNGQAYFGFNCTREKPFEIAFGDNGYECTIENNMSIAFSYFGTQEEKEFYQTEAEIWMSDRSGWKFTPKAMFSFHSAMGITPACVKFNTHKIWKRYEWIVAVVVSISIISFGVGLSCYFQMYSVWGLGTLLKNNKIVKFIWLLHPWMVEDVWGDCANECAFRWIAFTVLFMQPLLKCTAFLIFLHVNLIVVTK